MVSHQTYTSLGNHWLVIVYYVQVSLTYHPAKNTLTIAVLKARNLKAKDINGKSGKKKAIFLDILTMTSSSH